MARILVVDDEPDVRELFNITLKMAGHVTETAQDGLEAVDKLAQGMPDLILLDLMMPRMDGFGFLNHIRNELDGKPVRVLVATAKVLEEADHARLSDWPVVGVLNKGELDIGRMVIVVSSALGRDAHRPKGRDEAQEGKVEAAVPGTPAPTSGQPAAAPPAKDLPPGAPGAGASTGQVPPDRAATGPPEQKN